MASPDDRMADFEARLAALKHKMERGLVERARTLRALADQLDAGDGEARKQLKTESHKLRGVAGSYGHDDLTELAGRLENRASMSPPATVVGLARQLATAAEACGRASLPPPPTDGASSRPSRRPSRPIAAPARPSPLPASGPPLRVLAMDDDPVTQRLLMLTLKQVGRFDATIVSSAAAALEQLRVASFDLVVSDAMMPDMDGRAFRRAARAAGATMPIVILSAASPAELGWEREKEADGGWLRKPFKPTELVRQLERIVAAHKKSG
jgi:CheY-like chemotaxis protein/HPt (histidine-containing phosphotransfer) domain-containing protein